MARLGTGIMVFAQKPWKTVVKELDDYRAVFRKVQGREAPKPILVQFVTVHEDAAVAQAMFDRYVVGYCASTLRHYEFDNEGLAKIPGYEYYGRMAQIIAEQGKESFIHHLAKLQVAGTPKQVAEQLIENSALIDAGSLICVFAFGGMTDDVAKANVDLFAREVLPVLQKRDVGDLGMLRQTAVRR
jgi:alkanesulfonate monooxygenase SsuD/methylene tetrahydromethanopterin reductase-like flavin-dependent oxidoreductase (luciferase family)